MLEDEGSLDMFYMLPAWVKWSFGAAIAAVLLTITCIIVIEVRDAIRDRKY